MITDVIYSSTTGSKEELERIKVWSGVLYEVLFVHNVEPLPSEFLIHFGVLLALQSFVLFGFIWQCETTVTIIFLHICHF